MPYIKAEDRVDLDDFIQELVDTLCRKYKDAPSVLGPLNYVLTRTFTGCLRYYVAGKPSYSVLAAFSGVLAHIQQEVYRRVIEPFEDHKVMDNGDIPEFEP